MCLSTSGNSVLTWPCVQPANGCSRSGRWPTHGLCNIVSSTAGSSLGSRAAFSCHGSVPPSAWNHSAAFLALFLTLTLLRTRGPLFLTEHFSLWVCLMVHHLSIGVIHPWLEYYISDVKSSLGHHHIRRHMASTLPPLGKLNLIIWSRCCPISLVYNYYSFLWN